MEGVEREGGVVEMGRTSSVGMATVCCDSGCGQRGLVWEFEAIRGSWGGGHRMV